MHASKLDRRQRVDPRTSSFAEACERVRKSTGVGFESARARAGFARGHLIDVVLHIPGGKGHEAEQRAAELLVLALLGEELYETWIGRVFAVPAIRGGPLRVLNDRDGEETTFPAAELAAAVVAAREGLLAGLAAVPHCDAAGADDDWTMFESTPEPAPDYAAQDDLVLATSRTPEMLKCFLQGQPFSSVRFSRHAELFVYLKIDQAELAADRRLRDRTSLEDALDRALRPARLGCVIGNGLGLRYAYVNLALLEPSRAIALVSSRARELGVGKRSRLLFCDSDCEHEWLGIWPDSPPPPG